MKVVPALVVVLLAWVMLTVAATTTSSEINGGRKPTTRPPTMELDLKALSKDKYSELIATLRRTLENPGQKLFGIPRLRALSKSEYIYIKLISAQRNSIELAIDKKDIYVVGYSYKNGDEARCFKNIFQNKQCKVIFDEAKIVQNIGYDGRYEMLQSKAGVGVDDVDRREVQLGMKALGSFIDQISKTHPGSNPQAEAKLLLVAIQMVCEAVRFKYIENKVRGNIPKDFKPDYRVISLEISWGKLSTAITRANPKTGRFEVRDGKQTFVKLWTARRKDWLVTNANDIKQDIGLLTSVGAAELPKWPLDDNVPVSAQSSTSPLATM